MQKNRIIRILPRHASKSTFHIPINFSFIIGFVLGALISAIGSYLLFKWYSIQPENSHQSVPAAAKTLDNMLTSAPSDDRLNLASPNPVIKLPETELRRSSADTSRQTKVNETQDTRSKSHNPFTQLSTTDRASSPSPLANQGRVQANNHNLKRNNDSKKTTNTAVSKTQVETKVEKTAKARVEIETEASAPTPSSKPITPSARDMETSKTNTQQQIQSEKRSTTIQISQPLTNQQH